MPLDWLRRSALDDGRRQLNGFMAWRAGRHRIEKYRWQCRRLHFSIYRVGKEVKEIAVAISIGSQPTNCLCCAKINAPIRGGQSALPDLSTPENPVVTYTALPCWYRLAFIFGVYFEYFRRPNSRFPFINQLLLSPVSNSCCFLRLDFILCPSRNK